MAQSTENNELNAKNNLTNQIHIACASLNQTPLDWCGNFNNIKSVINDALNIGVDILCLPELSIPGYNCEDMFMAEWVIDKSKETLVKVSKICKNITVILGLPFKYDGVLYNCAAIVRDSKIYGIVPKQILANEEIYYESRWFAPWKGGVTEFAFDDQTIPIGTLIFEQDRIKFGLEICEDAWNTLRPGLKIIDAGARIIFNPSASHFCLGKMEKRIKLATDLQEHNSSLVYAYTNLLGNEAGRAIYDGSSFIAFKDQLNLAPRFSFKDYELISDVFNIKSQSNEFDNTSNQYQTIIIKYSQPKINTYKPTGTKAREFESGLAQDLKFHEFTLAVSLGIYDYIRKSGNKRIVISLSGGADSASCAILAKIALDRAILERGVDKVKLDLNITENPITLDFLYCVYQKTINNSVQTEKVASDIAKQLGAHFSSIPIDNTISIYKTQIEEMLNIELSWNEHSVPLQNIQARSRGPLIWMLANLKNALLIATSNRSEAAVGYTTMDGDTCGGLSPLGGIDKTFILAWLKWLEINSLNCYGNFPFLSNLNKLKPSAELKPLNELQTDEKELMPYPVLNTIEKLFIRDKIARILIIQKTHQQHNQYTKVEIEGWVDKFLHLWRINQWKRERYAPSFHLDDESLDPKTWCRYPILSGKLT